MKREFSFAIRRSIPVLFGYLFLGIAFGLLFYNAGYNFILAAFASIFIYAGSAQYTLIKMLSEGEGLLPIALLMLSINSRHIFYGLSFIEKFKSMGRRGLYMIFSLTDETYSLLCSTKLPKPLDEDKTLFYIAILDHIYWVCGTLLGSLIGRLIPFNSTGVEFAMTALFVVIFVEQWIGIKNHVPALVGAVCGVVSLIISGPNVFALPALIATVAIISLIRAFKPTGKGETL